jgi:hypothetical protein
MRVFFYYFGTAVNNPSSPQSLVVIAWLWLALTWFLIQQTLSDLPAAVAHAARSNIHNSSPIPPATSLLLSHNLPPIKSPLAL